MTSHWLFLAPSLDVQSIVKQTSFGCMLIAVQPLHVVQNEVLRCSMDHVSLRCSLPPTLQWRVAKRQAQGVARAPSSPELQELGPQGHHQTVVGGWSFNGLGYEATNGGFYHGGPFRYTPTDPHTTPQWQAGLLCRAGGEAEERSGSRASGAPGTGVGTWNIVEPFAG